MKQTSAGLLMFRDEGDRLEVLLVHPGGPIWAKRDLGAWSIPKGQIGEGEMALEAAIREMEEETGIAARGPFTELGSIRQKGGKEVHAWAFRGNCDPAAIRSNHFEMEWPPRSGRRQSFPEVDRAAWFSMDEARLKLVPAQTEFLGRLLRATASSDRSA